MEAGQRSEGSRKQHVVAVPFPAQGHLNPLLRFCHLLASHGLLVTFVNIDPVHRRIEELKQQQLPGAAAQPAQLHAAVSGLQQNITFAHVPIYGLDLSNNFRVSFQPFLEAQNSIASHLELLILRLSAEGPAVTCILSDIGMTTPTQNVADKLNIPRIVFFPSSASFLLLHVYAIQGDRISTTKACSVAVLMLLWLSQYILIKEGVEVIMRRAYCASVAGGLAIGVGRLVRAVCGLAVLGLILSSAGAGSADFALMLGTLLPCVLVPGDYIYAILSDIWVPHSMECTGLVAHYVF